MASVSGSHVLLIIIWLLLTPSSPAVLIPGRKNDQCGKRYTDILNPQAKDRLSHWSPLEDDILREGVQTLGHRWSAISAKLPGRPPLKVHVAIGGGHYPDTPRARLQLARRH